MAAIFNSLALIIYIIISIIIIGYAYLYTGVITNHTTGKTYKAQPFPEFIQNIIKKGGLLASLKDWGV